MRKSVYYLRTTRLLGCFVTMSLHLLVAFDQCPACIFCLRQRKTAIVLWFCLPGSALLRYFWLLFLPATFLYTVHPGTMWLSAVHFVRFIDRVETGVFGDSKPGLFLDVCVILQESPVRCWRSHRLRSSFHFGKVPGPWQVHRWQEPLLVH